MFPKTPKGPLYQQWVSAQPTLPEQLQIEAGSLEVLGVQSQPHSGAESAWIVLICEEKKNMGENRFILFLSLLSPKWSSS